MAWYRLVAKLSHFSFVFMKKLMDFLDALTSGFWLGVMGEKSLDYSDELYYNRMKYYTEEKYNESGLFEWEKLIIAKHFSEVKTILLIAAGGGREVLALNKMGYEVDPYECNPLLANFGNDLLRKNNYSSEIKVLARNSVPGEYKRYDAVIIGWGAYSLIRSRKQRIEFLVKLSPFLNTGAPLMISFLFSRRRTKEKIIKCVSDFFRFLRFKERTEPGDKLVPNFIRYFTEDEIKNEMIQSGYKIDDYTADDYGCIIATIASMQ